MQCEQCGFELREGARICRACGFYRPVVVREMTMPEDKSLIYQPEPPAAANAVDLLIPATKLQRALAHIADQAIIAALGTVVFAAAGHLGGLSEEQGVLDLLGWWVKARLLLAFGDVFWETAWVASSKQATPGKLLVGTIVVDRDGSRLSLPHAFVRSLVKRVVSDIVPLGWITLFLGYPPLALHDMITGTRVVSPIADASASGFAGSWQPERAGRPQ